MKLPKLVKLKSVAKFVGGSTPLRDRTEYFGGGIPWVKTTDLNNGKILTTEETLTDRGLEASSCKMIPRGAVLVAMYGGFRQIGRSGLLTQASAINQALTAILPDADSLDPQFLLEWLNFRVGYWKRFAGSSRKDPNITKNDVEDFPIPLFSLMHQQMTISLLAEWDTAIEKASALTTALERRKQGLMQQLLTGRKRLKGFKGKWKSVRVGSFADDVRSINTTARALPVLSCTKYAGLVDSLKYFKKQVFSENSATYKIVERGQFVYATNHIEEGSIGYQDLYDAALVSPMYTVFEPNAEVIDHQFLYMLLKTEAMRRVFEATTHSSVDRRGSLRWPEFAKLKISIPPMLEQQQIVTVLKTALAAVDLAKQQLDELKAQKRALMQKLLSGEWRLPEKPVPGKSLSKKCL